MRKPADFFGHCARITTCLTLLVILMASCVHPELRDKSKEYQEGWRMGTAEAKKEMASGAMTIYTYGFGARSGVIHEPTGLPYLAIASCVVDDFTHGRKDGHDRLIYAELGLPWVSGRDMVFDDFGDAPMKMPESSSSDR